MKARRVRPSLWPDQLMRMRRRAIERASHRLLEVACAQAGDQAAALGHSLGVWRRRRDNADAFAFCQRCVGVVVVSAIDRRPTIPGSLLPRPRTSYRPVGAAVEQTCVPSPHGVDRAIDLCMLNGYLPWASQYGPLSFLQRTRSTTPG